MDVYKSVNLTPDVPFTKFVIAFTLFPSPATNCLLLGSICRQGEGGFSSRHFIMKAKMQEARAGRNAMSVNEQVRSEIEAFLQALISYPARFEQNPQITFAEHCRALGITAKARGASAGS